MDSKTKEILQKFSTQKVELGIYQDLENKLRSIVPKFNQLEKISEERQDVGIKFSKLKDQESSLAQEIKADGRVLEKDLSIAKAKVKELGVDVDFSFIERNLKQIDSAIKSNTAF